MRRVCLIKKSVNDDLSRLITLSTPQLRSAPLMTLMLFFPAESSVLSDTYAVWHLLHRVQEDGFFIIYSWRWIHIQDSSTAGGAR